MRRLALPFFTLLLFAVGFSGCSDTVVVVGGAPVASVNYDFWAGARTVEVDGEIFNDGGTYIQSVELEIILYDEFGHYINSVYQTFWVDLVPQSSFFFNTDIREFHVYDVDVVIHRVN